MSNEVRVILQGATVVLTTYVEDWDGNRVDPTSVKLDLYNPDHELVLDGVTMDKDGVGVYVYYYTDPAMDKGWWLAIATITDGAGAGAKITKPVGVFRIK